MKYSLARKSVNEEEKDKVVVVVMVVWEGREGRKE